MSAATHLLTLPQSIKKAAERLAEEDGVSLDVWISVAVAQKIGAVETAEEFFRKRSQGADIERALDFLRMAPDIPPLPGDELPEGYTPKSFKL